MNRSSEFFDIVDSIETGPPPTAELRSLGAARRRARRDRVTVVVCVAITACCVGSALFVQDMLRFANLDGDVAGQDGGNLSQLDAEPTRLIGVSGVAIAVPQSWNVGGVACGLEPVGSVFIGLKRDCESDPNRAISEVAISHSPLTPGIAMSSTSVDLIGEYSATRSDPCSPDATSCVLAWGVPELGAYFEVSIRGDGAASRAETIIASTALLQHDVVAVPLVDGLDPSEIAQQLSSAGLTSEIEYLSCAAGASCMDGSANLVPSVGTVVPQDSVVIIRTYQSTP